MRDTLPTPSFGSTGESVLVLVGPTGSGKTALSLQIASQWDVEIVSADSMQIYRGMDIGTAKPSPADRGAVPHHLIDIVDPDESYHAARFRKDADRAISEILGRKKHPLVVGGTGLYVKALLHGLFPDTTERPAGTWDLRLRAYRDLGGGDPHARLAERDPEAARRIHPHDEVRARRALEVILRTGRSISELQDEHGFQEHRYKTFLFGLLPERERLYDRINDRVDGMMEAGLLQEVQSLLDRGYGETLPCMQGLGYRQMRAVLKGQHTLAEAVRLMKRDTRRYAKRQITWFQNQEKVTWFDAFSAEREICNAIQYFLQPG